MKQYIEAVTDELTDLPIAGAEVWIYDDDNNLATLYASDGTTEIGNPLTTNEDGEFSFYSPRTELTALVYYASRQRRRLRLLVGGGYSLAAQASAQASLAAAGVGEYANTASGLADTAISETFWVDLGNGLGQIYRHDSGPVATPLNSFILDPTQEAAASVFAGGVPTSSDLASSSGGALIGFQQNLDDASERTLLLKGREAVSVQDFGAIGDGAADDTAAVQAAIDSGAGAILVPRGVYVVDAVEGTDIHLYGPGTIRKKAGTKGAMISLFGANRIEGITIDYDWENADQSAPNFGNAAVEQVQGSLDLAGVKFVRSFDSAVYNVGANLSIDGACSFTGGKPHNGLTGGNERPTYYVFCIADEDTEDQVISIGGAYFEGASLDPDELHLNPTGIFITASAVDGYRFRAINISNPTLLGCTTNAGNGNVTGAIDLYNGADNIVISGATIRYFTYAGIKVQNSSYFSITGNTLTDGSVPSGAHTPHANGIVTIEKARSSTVEQKFGVVSGNIIDGCAYSGITNSCDYVTIADNVINGVALVGGIATGINNAASHVTIANNVGTDVLGVQILTDGNHVRIIGNEMSSGSGAADTALRFTGSDILIEANSFTSGTIAGSTGIRTNGPASNIRVTWNYVDNFPYGVDIRTGSGAVDKIVKGPNQFANISIADYNLGGSVTNATQVSTAVWT